MSIELAAFIFTLNMKETIYVSHLIDLFSLDWSQLLHRRWAKRNTMKDLLLIHTNNNHHRRAKRRHLFWFSFIQKQNKATNTTFAVFTSTIFVVLITVYQRMTHDNYHHGNIKTISHINIEVNNKQYPYIPDKQRYVKATNHHDYSSTDHIDHVRRVTWEDPIDCRDNRDEREIDHHRRWENWDWFWRYVEEVCEYRRYCHCVEWYERDDERIDDDRES